MFNTFVRSGNDDLDVTFRLQSKTNRAICLSDDSEVCLRERSDFIEFATHLDFDVLLSIEYFGTRDFDDRLALLKTRLEVRVRSKSWEKFEENSP